MTSFDKALSLMAEAVRPVGIERVEIGKAAGRTLSSPVIARVDSPPADVSAMDGYAIRDADKSSLRLIGVSYPSGGYPGTVCPGECVRVFTGAPVPVGADRVLVQEIMRIDGDRVVIEGKVGKDRHIRLRGEDFVAGDETLPSGTRLYPRSLVTAAAADLAEVEVFRRPRVVIIGTGDELVDPGTSKHHLGTIPESVTLGVAALVEQFGAQCISRRCVGDDITRLRAAAGDALQIADLVVMTGGASVGEKDFAKAAFDELGLKLIFSKVAIKPGKPIWFGLANGRPVMGLPGNPTSALVTARLFLAPLIAAMSGGDPKLYWLKAPLAEPLPEGGDRETFVRARWRDARVAPLSNQDSGAQRALADAALLIRRAARCSASEVDDFVQIIDF